MKNILKLTIPCLLIFIFSYGVSNAQETTLFAAVAEVCGSTSVNSSLYTIDPVTAQAQEVGPTGFNGVTALAFLGDGRLVASANADDNDDRISILIEINPLTGQGTLIGTIGNDSIAGQCGRVPGLTYDHATDTLYGMGNRCPDSRSLLEINKTTGQGTIIGPGTGTGLFGSGNGLAIRDDGVMFWTPDEDLITINPNTGQVIQVKTLSVTSPSPLINGLAFHPVTGVLFGSNINPPEPLDFPNAILQTVNTTTGLLTTIGQLPDCTDGLVFGIRQVNVPTLSQWGLIAMAGVLGIIGFLALRRRKAAA